MLTPVVSTILSASVLVQRQRIRARPWRPGANVVLAHVASSWLFESSDIELRARLVTDERRRTVLGALIHLLLDLVRVRSARLVNDRLPDGKDKEQLLAAIARAAIAERIAANRRLDCGDCVVTLRRSQSGEESAPIVPKQE